MFCFRCARVHLLEEDRRAAAESVKNDQSLLKSDQNKFKLRKRNSFFDFSDPLETTVKNLADIL